MLKASLIVVQTTEIQLHKMVPYYQKLTADVLGSSIAIINIKIYVVFLNDYNLIGAMKYSLSIVNFPNKTFEISISDVV